jgi:hypothetical protein
LPLARLIEPFPNLPPLSVIAVGRKPLSAPTYSPATGTTEDDAFATGEVVVEAYA